MSDTFRTLEAYWRQADVPGSKTVMTKRYGYSPHQWMGNKDHPSLLANDPDVAWIHKHYSDEISRHDIIDGLGSDSPDQSTLDRRMLIASLMWGYGTSVGRHYRLRDICSFLSDQKTKTRLSKSRNCLASKDIGGAYKEFCDINGIGSAFFTKFLYFSGKSMDMDEFPLILDTKVSWSLASLSGYRRFVRSDHRPLSDSDGFCRYVSTMHGWAQRLGAACEIIEFVLWRDVDTIDQFALDWYKKNG
jgi:hypothetical protein